MGYRCEAEATGFVSYQWCKMIDWWQWALLMLPWGCFCAFILVYGRLVSFFRNKFREKEIMIEEKEVIVEKKIDDRDSGRLSTLISRLRKTLEGISSLIVFYDNKGTYQLKMPDSIEKNDDLM